MDGYCMLNIVVYIHEFSGARVHMTASRMMSRVILCCCVLSVLCIFTMHTYICSSVSKKNHSKGSSDMHMQQGTLNMSNISASMCSMLFSDYLQNEYDEWNNSSTGVVHSERSSKTNSTAETSIWVSAQLVGRLGNQLFILASSFGVAMTRNAKWCIVNNHENLAYDVVDFYDGKTPLECPPETGNFHVFSENNRFEHFHSSFSTDYPGNNVSVGVYLQSFRYFAQSGLPFRLKHAVWAKKWTSQRGINVGIHIRRGDFLEPVFMDIYSVPSIQYFRNAMHTLQQITNDVSLRFVISTDDVAWVRAHSEFNNMTILEGYTPSESMSILAACRHIIMSGGTFGWWANFLKIEQGYTFYYNKPLKIESNTLAQQGCDPEDHFPSEWIPLSDDKGDSAQIMGHTFIA